MVNFCYRKLTDKEIHYGAKEITALGAPRQHPQIHRKHRKHIYFEKVYVSLSYVRILPAKKKRWQAQKNIKK